MSHPRFRVFTQDLYRAARDYLAARGKAPREEYRLHVEVCPVHGPTCARVTVGMLRDHFDVFVTEPAAAAALLLATVLPPPPVRAAIGAAFPGGQPDEASGPPAGRLYAG